MANVFILLARGFEECEALIPADLLKRAGANVILVATEGGLAVPGSHGFTVTADITIDELRKEEMDCVILPADYPERPISATTPAFLTLSNMRQTEAISSPLSVQHPRYWEKCACSTAETPQFTLILPKHCNTQT